MTACAICLRPDATVPRWTWALGDHVVCESCAARLEYREKLKAEFPRGR